ncbi:hypothetical protein HRbin17_02732 [bacterium HR17]|uniref:Uncharacterized protein n=1 Tax=Candidatus Fervidibacter japonicus TaxID=2035412 RepID=A0A2H5XG83_9BACT|nr:hypothetical protein HRbin17_02732 [bacterium HR17]
MEFKTLLIALLIGMAFGATLSLSGAASHRMIVNALRLKDLRLLKIILTALAVGMLGVNLLDAAGMAHLKIKPAYLLGVALGGALFGVGFALAGYCPGTCVVATAERKKDAAFVLLGGLLGATTLGLLYPVIKPMLIDPLNLGEVRVPNLLGISPLTIATVLAVVLLAVAWLLPDRIGEQKEAVLAQPHTKAA